MQRVTTWQPDTCPCEVAIEWDDAEPQESRKHRFVGVKVCVYHVGLPDPGKAAHGDNFKKNDVLRVLIEKHPTLAEIVRAHYTEARVLTVTGVPPGLKAAVRRLLRQLFPGVEVE